MFINDSIHGLLRVNQLQQDLLAQPEVQRLQWIKQLGLSFLCYPGAVHTRISHSLGVSYVASKMAKHLDFPESDVLLIEAAAMLHDIGHLPFSHALEPLLDEDHMKISEDIITGKLIMPIDGAGNIPKILEKHHISPEEVGELVTCNFSRNNALQKMIFGDCDADQMDYLVRDAYFCGVPHGNIDIDRIIYTTALSNDGNRLLLLEKGIEAIEEMIVARDHMYSSIYTHKTGRIAETMLLRACESVKEKLINFNFMIDAQLLSKLLEFGGFSKEIANRLITRRLYKTASVILSHDEDLIEKLITIMKDKTPQELEKELCERCNLECGKVIVDFPNSTLELTEPRLREINITVLTKKHEEFPLHKISELTNALLNKKAVQMIVGIYTPEEYRSIVSNEFKKILGV
jgi:HD superfamily phosphohydrolase